jgi:hypothetical protein
LLQPARLPHCLTVAAAFLGNASVTAQSAKANLYPKFELSLAVPAVILNSDIRVDGSGGRIGTDLDAEDDLGLAKTKFQPRVALRWRPGRRHELEVGYQFARRTGETILEREIDFVDSTYEVGTPVRSRFDSDEAFLVYRFAFMARDRTQVGAALGVGALFLDIGLDALAAGTGEVDFSQSARVTGPLGSIGLFGRLLAGDRWRFGADLRYIQISIDRFEPRVFEAGAEVLYAFSHSVAVEAGYGGSAIRIDVGPKTRAQGETGLVSGQIKYSLQNVRLGIALTP